MALHRPVTRPSPSVRIERGCVIGSLYVRHASLRSPCCRPILVHKPIPNPRDAELRSVQARLEPLVSLVVEGLESTLKNVGELNDVLDELAGLNAQATDLASAGTLAKSVNRCSKAGSRLFTLTGSGTVDRIHDAGLRMVRRARTLVNGWRQQVGRPVLADVAGVDERRPLAEYLQAEAQPAAEPEQARGPLSPPTEEPRAPARERGANDTPAASKAPALVPGTGDATRDEAIAILAHALAPAYTPHEVAAQLEQQLFLDHREAAAVGDEYLRALRALWSGLSVRSASCRPLLRLLLLNGGMDASRAARATAEEVKEAEQAYAAQLVGASAGALPGTSGSQGQEVPGLPIPTETAEPMQLSD